uniref:Uncharacterized protein n=1 Tax=Molossus molossus TaxID=27622 RepID=A0A7J8J0B6_MOLMO|nr:hypothetical protein HJG59_010315 [Molossus molossus]
MTIIFPKRKTQKRSEKAFSSPCTACYIPKNMACLDCNVSSEKRLRPPAVEKRDGSSHMFMKMNPKEASLGILMSCDRARDDGLSDCCRTSVSATGLHWGGERKNETCQHNKWSCLVQTVMHFAISVGTGDRCDHEEHGGPTGRPARMFKDISGYELYDGAIRSDLWKPAIKTELHFSINRFKQ